MTFIVGAIVAILLAFQEVDFLYFQLSEKLIAGNKTVFVYYLLILPRKLRL